MWWRGCDFGWGAGWFMGPFMIIFWIAILALVMRLFRRPGYWHYGHWGPPADADPREIARRRYAKGEITREEFTEIMKSLG